MHIATAMKARSTARTAKPQSVAERKARLARLVERGEVTPEQAKLIRFDAPSEKTRATAATLKDQAAAFHAKKRRAVA